MTDQVVGLVFDDESRVLLIRKNRPEWQNGMLNGIGGRVNLAEAPCRAMTRELHEETGLVIHYTNWRLLAELDTGDGSVYYYAAHIPSQIMNMSRSLTDERVSRLFLSELAHFSLVPDLRWLIPFALDDSKRYTTLHVEVDPS